MKTSRRGTLNQENNIKTPVAMPHDRCFILLLPVYSELKNVPSGTILRATRDNCV